MSNPKEFMDSKVIDFQVTANEASGKVFAKLYIMEDYEGGGIHCIVRSQDMEDILDISWKYLDDEELREMTVNNAVRSIAFGRATITKMNQVDFELFQKLAGDKVSASTYKKSIKIFEATMENDAKKLSGGGDEA